MRYGDRKVDMDREKRVDPRVGIYWENGMGSLPGGIIKELNLDLRHTTAGSGTSEDLRDLHLFLDITLILASK